VVARNLAIDYLRKKEKDIKISSLFQNKSSNVVEEVTSFNLFYEGYENQLCEVECIMQALSHMSLQYRRCLVLQDVWGYSQREIAEALSITEKTVSVNVCRGRRQLREAYR